MRNAKREPLTQEERQQLVAVIDAEGGIAAFSTRHSVGAGTVGHVLVGQGALPATRRVLLDALRDHIFSTVRAARGREGGGR
ncbi:MAG: hypothetical protein Q8S13_11310 [Dehalococcoidia bacterium]|nr:hypothetical protein [Dehalococcoidia bacterium]